MSPSPPDLKEDDVGCNEDADALQQIPHHVDEGCTDAGIGLFMGVGLLMSPSMAVPVPRLVQSCPHPAGRAAVTSPGHRPPAQGVTAHHTYTMLTATAQAEVMSMTLPSMS